MPRKRTPSKKKKDSKTTIVEAADSKRKKTPARDHKVGEEEERRQEAKTPVKTPSLSQSLSLLAESQQQAQHVDKEKFDGDSVRPSLPTKELFSNVKEIAEELRKVRQVGDKSEIPWNRAFEQALVDRKLMNVKEKEIQIHVANAIAEVLRIIAPESCYDASTQKRVFKFFIEQLETLKESDDPIFSHRFRLLELLSSIKAFVLLTDPEMDAGHILEDLFDRFFSIASESETLSTKVVSYMAESLISVIETMDIVSDHILKRILEQLAKVDSGNEEHSAYSLAKQILDRCTEQLLSPMTDYIKGQVDELEKKRKKKEETFRKSRGTLFKIIYQLCLIAPRLLLLIVPILSGDLKHANTEVRFGVIQLFGNMFSARESTMAKDYKNLFEEFLGRFNDTEPKIRGYMAKFAGTMIVNHVSTAGEINVHLEKHILDGDEKVRRSVIETVCNVAQNHHHLISESIMQQFTERCRDKKVEMRVYTQKLLAQLYRHHAVSVLSKGEFTWPEDLLRKFGHIPNVLLTFYIERQDPEHKIYLETLIDEHLLPPEPNLRSRILLDLYSRLQRTEKTAVDSIFNHKQVYRQQLKEFLDFKDDSVSMEEEAEEKKTDTVPDKEENKPLPPRLDAIITLLANYLPDPKIGRKFWRRINKNRGNDNPIIKLLHDCLQADSTAKVITELKIKVASMEKSEKKENFDYLKLVFHRASVNIICKEHIEEMFRVLEHFVNEEYFESAASLQQLLQTIADSLPELFTSSYKSIALLLENNNDGVLERALRLMCKTGKNLDALFIRDNLEEKLEILLPKLCEHSSYRVAKYAAQAISVVFYLPEPVYGKVMANTLKKLDNKHDVLSILTTLRMIAQCTPRLFDNHASDILDFAFDNILMRDRDDNSESWEEQSKESKAKVLCIKLLAQWMISKAKLGMSPEYDSLSERISKFLFQVLEKQGDLEEKIHMEQETNDEEERSVTPTIDQVDFAHLRLAAAKAILKIHACPECHLSLSMQHFLTLAFVTNDPNEKVRLEFAKALQKGLCNFSLNLKFASILLLAVGDPLQENALHARNYITVVIKVYRTYLSSHKDISLTSISAPKVYPEYILPYLIYLLSKHPNLEKESPQFFAFQRILFAYFDDVTNDVDNIAFFHKLIPRIKHLKDAYDSSSMKHCLVCDLVFIILNRVVEGKTWNSITYPGNVFVPNFFLSPAHTTPTRGTQRADIVKLSNLPKEFKIHDRYARKFTLDETPKTPKKSPVKQPKKSPAKQPPSSANKPKKSKMTPKPKETSVSPRSKLKRSAKKNVMYREEEEQDPDSESESEEEQEEHEEEMERTKKKSAAKRLDFNEETTGENKDGNDKEETSPQKQTTSTPIRKRTRITKKQEEDKTEEEKEPEQEEKEPETTTVKSRKRRRIATN